MYVKKILEMIHEGHEETRRKIVDILPSCSFVPFVDRIFLLHSGSKC